MNSNPESLQHKTIFHQAHSVNESHLDQTLQRLHDDSVEIDEILNLLKGSEPFMQLVMAEAELAIQQSQTQREIRSERHAIAIVGLDRLRRLLDQQRSVVGQMVRKTA